MTCDTRPRGKPAPPRSVWNHDPTCLLLACRYAEVELFFEMSMEEKVLSLSMVVMCVILTIHEKVLSINGGMSLLSILCIYTPVITYVWS